MMRRCTIITLACALWTTIVFAGPGLSRSNDRKMSHLLGHFIMGVVLEDLGDVDAALQEYAQSLKADQKAVPVRLHVAAGLIKKNDIDGAVRELTRIVLLDPDAVEPHAILALLYGSRNKPDLAAAEYERALKNASKIEPANIDIYKSLGIIYLKQKKFKDAEVTYKLILDLGGKDAETYFYLANAFFEQKNIDGTESALKTALVLKPDYDEALNFLGYLYVEQDKDRAEAERLIRKALELSPANGAYVDSLGWLYFKQGRYEDAVRELERASALLDDPTVFDHLGDAYRRVGDISKAQASWEKSLKLDPAQDTVKIKLKKP